MEPTQLTSLLSSTAVNHFKPAHAVGQPLPQKADSLQSSTSPQISKINPNSPQQLLNQQIMASLNERLGSEGLGKIEELDSSEFTPEKVADRIMGFIRNGLALAASNGADADKVDSLMAKAREGVETGFKQAQEILKGIGALDNQGVADSINKTYALLQEGLDKLENPARMDQSAGVSESASYSRSEQLSLQLTTREGDTVTLMVERNSSASSSQSISRNEGGTTFTSSRMSSAESRFSYSVEGDLNQDEQKSIDQLMQRMDGIADRFFNGQTQAALSQANNLNYDSDTIADYAIGLTRSESSQSQQAITAYQKVSQLGPLGVAISDDTPPTERFRKMGEYLQEIKGALSDSKLHQLFNAPEKVVSDLVKGTLAMDERASGIGSLPDDARNAMQKVNDALIQSLIKQQQERLAAPQESAPESQREAVTDPKEGSINDIV
ncbi:MAG: DUF5610 domain-containing protein [Gammaproteobacteria bacterium]|nr:DUF5610 domain-containing protein [Gammaproteobacteria bacterium]